MLHADEAQRVAGAGLVAYLFRAILRRGIEVCTETSAEALLVEDGRVVGLPPGTTGGLEWLARGHTLAELAQRLGLPPAELEATVTRFNAHARRGEDPDFGRHPDSLGPVEKPPFYGFELATPDPFRATITVIVNRSAQVLHDATKQPIPGLYACGSTVATDRWLGVGYQAGCQLMGAVIFGFLAAEHAAACP